MKRSSVHDDLHMVKSSCSFVNHNVELRLPGKRKLSRFLTEMILHYTGRSSLLQYVFVSDQFLHKMNVDFLGHDTYTDIITFDLSDPGSSKTTAEIYISLDRVQDNANTEGIPWRTELLRVIIHGALHLCGFKDKTKKQKEEMRALENKWMADYLTG